MDQLTVKLDPSQVIKSWGEVFNTNIASVCELDRHWRVSLPRQVLMYCLRKYTVMSYCQIAYLLDRTHATAIYAYNAVENTYLSDRSINEPILKLTAELDELSGRVAIDVLNVRISRNELLQILRVVSDEERKLPMIKLWEMFKNMSKDLVV